MIAGDEIFWTIGFTLNTLPRFEGLDRRKVRREGELQAKHRDIERRRAISTGVREPVKRDAPSCFSYRDSIDDVCVTLDIR